MCCLEEMWELTRVKEGSHQPSQNVCEGGVGCGQDEALSVGKASLESAGGFNQRGGFVSGISEKEC